MKKVAMGFALALAASAFAAHPQTINKEGFVGVNKTQSAQSLGHSKLVFTLLGDATFNSNKLYKGVDATQAVDPAFVPYVPSSVDLIETRADYDPNDPFATSTTYAPVKNSLFGSANIGFAIGIWHYFDLGVTLPVYYDQFNASGTKIKMFVVTKLKPRGASK